MTKLKYKELDKVNGGSYSGAGLNALTKIFTSVYDIGYALGVALKKMINKNICLN